MNNCIVTVRDDGGGTQSVVASTGNQQPGVVFIDSGHGAKVATALARRRYPGARVVALADGRGGGWGSLSLPILAERVAATARKAKRRHPGYGVEIASFSGASADRSVGRRTGRCDLIDASVQAVKLGLAGDAARGVTVYCTEATADAGYLTQALRSALPNPIAVRPSPGLARLVDAGLKPRIISDVLKDYVTHSPESLVLLGCSHYVAFKQLLVAWKIVDPMETFIDLVMESCGTEVTR
jgi:glutamate racemase